MFELNDETRWILGRSNFWCGPIAEMLRKGGFTIRRKAEDEQAAVIHWLLTIFEKHGEGRWRVEAEVELSRMRGPSPADPAGQSTEESV